MENYYRLTKKELSFITSAQKPVIGYNGKRLSTPVVAVVSCDNRLMFVYSLKRYKRCVKFGTLRPNIYSYHICVMY